METPKTAEELIRSISTNRANLQYIIEKNRINGSLLADIKYVMEEYATIKAEQARSEERSNHELMAAIVRGLLENEDVPEDGKYMIEEALAAAGYGKEGK